MSARYWIMEENVKMLKEKGWKVRIYGDGDVGSDYDVVLSREGGLLYFDIDDPVIVPSEVVLKVTIKTYFYENFLPEGKYRIKGAELTVETDMRKSGKYQEVTTVASSIEGAKKLYELVRQGKLDKVEMKLWKSLEVEDVQKKSLLQRIFFKVLW